MWRVWGVSPFLLPFGDCIQLSILPVPVRTTLTELFGLAQWGCSSHRPQGSFHLSISSSNPASFVSSPIPDSLPSITSVTHSCCGEGTFLRVELCQQSSHSLQLPIDNPVKNIGIKINLHLMCEFYP